MVIGKYIQIVFQSNLDQKQKHLTGINSLIAVYSNFAGSTPYIVKYFADRSSNPVTRPKTQYLFCMNL
jgi:hypothetical protein